ncbi:hypothetical protein [Methylorubrum populi]
MIRPLRAVLAGLVLAGASLSASAQTYTLPEIGLQNSGTLRSLAVRDRVNNTMTPFGYVDTAAKDFVSTGRVPLRPDGDVADYPASTRFLDKVLGGIANKLPGTPSADTLTRGLQDVVAFYAYGGKADGQVHPLSSVTSLNGVNTSGYTLAQWQSFYSACADNSNGKNPVTALTDELDELAIQCVINKKTDNGTLFLPAGVMYQTKPILSGRTGLDVRGVGGPISTRLVQRTAGQDGWHHGTTDTGFNGTYYAILSMQNVQLLCGQGGGSRTTPLVCGTALKVDYKNLSGSAGFTLQDFGIGAYGDQAANYWFNGLNCNSCSLTQLSRVTIGGGNTIAGTINLQNMGTAMVFTGNHSVQFLIRDTTTNYFKTGILIQVGSNDNTSGTDQEGFIFDNWQANQVMDALVTQNSIGNGFLSPQIYIVNSQFNICHRLLYLAQVSEVYMGNNLIYGCSAGLQTGGTADYTQFAGQVTGTTTSGSKTVTLTAAAPSGLKAGVPIFGQNIPSNTTVAAVSGSTVTLSNNAIGSGGGQTLTYGAGSPGFAADEFMVFSNVQRISIKDNTFAFGSLANISTLGNFIQVSDGTVENNKIQYVFNSSMGTGWFNNTNNARLVERGTNFVGPAAWFVPVAGATNNVANGVRFESFYNQYATILRSDKSLQYDASVVVNLDGNKNASLFIPPTFTAVPYSIQVTNGGMDASTAFCGVNFANTSLSGVGISCPAAAAGTPVRINYTLFGKQ